MVKISDLSKELSEIERFVGEVGCIIPPQYILEYCINIKDKCSIERYVFCKFNINKYNLWFLTNIHLFFSKILLIKNFCDETFYYEFNLSKEYVLKRIEQKQITNEQYRKNNKEKIASRMKHYGKEYRNKNRGDICTTT